jgi:hypothetical protein
MRETTVTAAALLLVANEAAPTEAASRTTVQSGSGSTSNYGIAATEGMSDPAVRLPPIDGLIFGAIGTITSQAQTPPEHAGVWGAGNLSAGVFYGTVVVTGNHIVQGGKFAAVKAPDGSHRLLHAVEAPEAWFEDVGRGQLVKGKATVKLDSEFAGAVSVQDYHVFLTPLGETRGLFVGRKTPAGFEVQEQGVRAVSRRRTCIRARP